MNPPAGAKPFNQLDISDLFQSPRLDEITKKSFVFVPRSATLAEVKNAMDQQTRQMGNLGSCEDAFLTESGSATLPVVGWITNDIITENSKV